MAYTVSQAGQFEADDTADIQHAKGITHRDLKPEVRLSKLSSGRD
jgi:hypothetical protein